MKGTTLDVLEEGCINRCHTQSNKCVGYGKASCHKQIKKYIFPDTEEQMEINVAL
jgi:hypothetical protein